VELGCSTLTSKDKQQQHSALSQEHTWPVVWQKAVWTLACSRCDACPVTRYESWLATTRHKLGNMNRSMPTTCPIERLDARSPWPVCQESYGKIVLYISCASTSSACSSIHLLDFDTTLEINDGLILAVKT
jgi:hypothetical protein